MDHEERQHKLQQERARMGSQITRAQSELMTEARRAHTTVPVAVANALFIILKAQAHILERLPLEPIE